MDNLSSLLVMLQQNGLNKTYDNAVKSISLLRDTLIAAKDEVNDEVMRLILEDKHLEIGKLGPIPSMCLEIADKLNVLLNVENKEISSSESNIENKVEEKIEEKPFGEVVNISKNVEEEEIYEYNSIVTTIKGIKVGAKLLHNSFGVGEVLSLEDNEKSNTKLLTIKFADEEKPKKFTCTEEILEKYFGIGTIDKPIYNVENVEKNIEKGYNLYTSLDFFTFKRPYKIKIFGEETTVKKWNQTAQVLFKYLYSKDSDAFMNVRQVRERRGFSTYARDFIRPIEIIDGLYFEGNRSASDCLKTMSAVSEQFLDVFLKDVRKNVEIFVR